MRGEQDPQVSMLAFIDMETRVPLDHPLRTIRRLADEALAALSPTFDAMYAVCGRPSIPPERQPLGAAVEGVVVDQFVLGPQRAGLLRAVGLRPAVPLVSGHESDRAQLRPEHVQQEPPATAGAQRGSAVLRPGGPPSQYTRFPVGRALHRRRHAD